MKRRMYRFASLSVVLFAAWVLYTQDFHPASLVTGAVMACLAAGFSFSVFYEELPQSRFFWRLDLVMIYLVFLMWETVSSSVTLIYLMLRGGYSPGIVRVKTRLQSRIGRTLLANTISLVPGTLSLWMEGPYIFVHWFDRKTSHRLHAGKLILEPMESLLEKIFG